MEEITPIILYTLGAGACIPLGGLLAYIEKIRPAWLENELRHSVKAVKGSEPFKGTLVAEMAAVAMSWISDHSLGRSAWMILLLKLLIWKKG